MPKDRADVGQDLHTEGIKHIGLHVHNVPEVRAELERRGVVFVTPTGKVPNSGGAHYAFLHDNNGILIELFQPA